MSTPRIRMVAGPNGSGKTTLALTLAELKIPLGYNLNPDAIEKTLGESGLLKFVDWGVQTDAQTLHKFMDSHPLAAQQVELSFEVVNNVLRGDPQSMSGYFTAMLCDFIRQQWLAMNASFTFETVMSSHDKVVMLRNALGRGYRTYLYYVCTDGPDINEGRISARVSEGGHDVPKDKIASRFERSLRFLPEAIAHSTRAYIFDNSGTSHLEVAEYEMGRLIKVSEKPPAWFITNVMNKKA